MIFLWQNLCFQYDFQKTYWNHKKKKTYFFKKYIFLWQNFCFSYDENFDFGTTNFQNTRSFQFRVGAGPLRAQYFKI